MIETPFIPPPAVAPARTNGRIPLRIRLAIFRRAAARSRLACARMVDSAIDRGDVFVGRVAAGRVVLGFAALPRAGELEVRRIWRLRPALAVPATVTIELRNIGTMAIHARDRRRNSAAIAPRAADARSICPRQAHRRRRIRHSSRRARRCPPGPHVSSLSKRDASRRALGRRRNFADRLRASEYRRSQKSTRSI